MSLARIVFEQKKLAQRYGVVGRIAGRYLEAGYSVAVGLETPAGRVGFLAQKAGERIAVDVYTGSVRITKEQVVAIADKAAALKAKPVLALHGRGVKVTPEALEEAKKRGVAIKRFKAGA